MNRRQISTVAGLAVVFGIVAEAPAVARTDDCVVTGRIVQASVTIMGTGAFSGCPRTDGESTDQRVVLPQNWAGDSIEWSLAGNGLGSRMRCTANMVLNGVSVTPNLPVDVDVQQFWTPGLAAPLAAPTNWRSWGPYQRPDAASLARALADPTRSRTANFAVDCGQDGSASWSRALDVLPAPPEERDPGLSIDNGAEYTNSTKVRLFLGWEKGQLYDEVKVSNDGGFAKTRPKEFELTSSDPIPWELVSSGSERLPKTVYIKYRVGSYPAYWVDKIYTDDIILDTIKPEVVSASLGGSGLTALAASARTVRVRARDNKSGIASMQISTRKPKKKAKVVKFRKSAKVATSGRVFVRVRDGAGNWSKWRSAA